MAETILKMQGIHKSFSGVPVLTEVSIQVKKGEVFSLLGTNGAGKSTLMKILTGAYHLDRGKIFFQDQEVRFHSPRDSLEKGIRFLPQELSIIPEMTVAENICISHIPTRSKFHIVDKKQMYKKSDMLLKELGIHHIHSKQFLNELSVPEQRIIEIARALEGNAKIIIMDEPTASISIQESNILFGIIDRLKKQGVSILYISHYLDEVLSLSDSIVVLRDGKKSGEFKKNNVNVHDIVESMVGERIENIFPKKTLPSPHTEEILRVENLSYKQRLHSLYFTIKKGEILGIFGLVGSGMEYLGKILFSALPKIEWQHITGRVFFEQKSLQLTNPLKSIAKGIGFVSAERKNEGIIADLSVRMNMTLPYIQIFSQNSLSKSFLRKKEELKHTAKWIQQLGIQTRGTEQEIQYLSGGNQQKLCLSRWISGTKCKLLILEEPTRGVDVSARQEIYKNLQELSKQGIALLVISTDAEEIAGISHRCIVMNRGYIAEELSKNLNAKELLRSASTV